MTDTPITPEPAKPQHDADNDSVVDAGASAAQTSTPAPEEQPAAAPTAATQATPVPAETAATPLPAAPSAPTAQAAPTSPAAPATAGPQPASWTAPEAQQPTPPQPAASMAATHETQPTPPQQYGQGYSGQQPAGQHATAQPIVHQQGAPSAQQPGQPAPNYGNGAFGQPTGQHAYAQAPYGHATAPGVPGAEKPAKKRSNTGLIIATLAIGALVGGLAGAGAGIGLYSATSNNATIKTVSGPQNITVNDPDNATTVTAVAAKASPSVVTIAVSSSSESGTGSGVVLSEDGYVLTNTHVITLDGQSSNVRITVTDNDGKIYTAKVVGTDPTTDLAVIKLDGASKMTPISWADSSKLNVGDTAVAIGAPLGLAGTVTDGIVSALNRSISIASSAAPKGGDNTDNGDGSEQNPFNFDFPGQGGQSQQSKSGTGTIAIPVVQTDASINPGNSGGALLNSKGELIGINVAIASAGGSSTSSQAGSIGVGFSIPSNLAKRVSDELIKNGAATHGLLGASISDSNASNDATVVGALIKEITSGGAAAAAGLKADDIIVNFNGLPITNATDLTAQVRALAAGSKAEVTYIRDGQTKTATVTLGSLPTE